MPYIKKENRKKWNDILTRLFNLTQNIPKEELEGELNYFITSLLNMVYTPKYFNYNRAVGLLECIKQEFYRQKVSTYENIKKKENGDVYYPG